MSIRLLAFAGVAVAVAAAQTPFDVAIIKLSDIATDSRSLVQAVPGRLVMRNFPAKGLIQFAYGVADYQISGGPAWIGGDHYDLEAKAAGSPAVQQMEGPMLQALLQDRFRLTVHRETRELPVVDLTMESGNTKLRPAKKDNCTVYSVDSPAPPAPPPGAPRPVFCGFPRLTSNGAQRTLDGMAVSIETLGANLSRSQLHSPVVNKTGLGGEFDIHLEWNADDVPDGPSLFAALKEQLGLKLESAKGAVDVIVIDHVERPSPN